MNYLTILQKNKKIMRLITAFILVFTFSGYSYAAGDCSQYIGQASLNEFFKFESNQLNHPDDFAEVKILNDSITAAEFETWTIRICENDANGNNNDSDGCSNNIGDPQISLNSFTDKTKPWLVLKDNNIGKYINFNTGFDAILLDGQGDLIDYLSVDGYTKAKDDQNLTCSLTNLVFEHEYNSSGSSAKLLSRKPDGIGPWEKNTAGVDPGTVDETNDVLPPPPPGVTYPFVTINNIAPNIGTTAIFTINLVDANGDPTTFAQDVNISYYTQDGTATVADNDYSAVPLTASPITITIPANQSSVTISIDISGSDFYDIGETFSLFLYKVESLNASIISNSGVATLDGTGCSFSTTGIIGGSEIDINANNITFNNTTLIEGTTTTNNSIILDGTITEQPIALPNLKSITFVNSPDINLSNNKTLPSTPGIYDYGQITVNDNATIYIESGEYNINQFNIGNNVTIIIDPVGKVVINTNEFTADGEAKINFDTTINPFVPFDPANLTVNIYGSQDAKFDLGDDSYFSGIVYSSYSNTEIEIDDNNVFVGGIFTAGKVQLKDGSEITYNDAARAAAFSVIGCLPIRTLPTVNTQVTPSPTPTITGTYDSVDAAGGFTVTVAGITYTLGVSTELTSSGDNWSLSITSPLTSGTYDVVATSTNVSGNTISDATINELTVGTASCFSDTYPIFAGQQLDIEKRIDLTANGTTTRLTEEQITQSAIDLAGTSSTQSPSLPSLPPIIFSNAPNKTLPADAPLLPGDYDLVTVDRNTTITLTAGTYNINQFIFSGGVTINITGKVIINANEFIYQDDNINPKIDGRATINAGGDPANLVVNIYNQLNAEFDLGNDSNFTGIVYSSFNTTSIEIDDDNIFTGAILSNGDVQIKDDSVINYTSQAKAAAASILNCSTVSIDHFSINYSDGAVGTGINCQASNITIETHDNNHNIVTDYIGTISLSTNTKAAATNFGDWSNTTIPTDANSTVVPIGTDSGTATYEFILADNGQVTLSFKNTHTEITELNVSQGTFSEASINSNINDDFEIDFANAGFNFLADTVNDAVGLQIGGKPSNVAPGIQTLELQAVKTNTTTGACESALQDTQSIEIAVECINPGSCSGNNLYISTDGSTFNQVDSPELTYFPISGFNFGDNTVNTAPFVIRYDDVGEIKLHARKTITPSNETIVGQSNQFVVRPFAFYTYVTGNPAATTPAGTAFTTAGTDFTTNVRAVLWQSADDDGSGGVGTASDGIADGHESTDTNPANNVNLSDNLVTKNYGQEITTEQVTLSSLLNQPSPGNDPGLNDSSSSGRRITSFNIATGIGSSSTINHPEVGIIEIFSAVNDTDYLGIGNTETNKIVGRSGYVGRFYPHHFDTTVTQGCNTFTYSGQPFRVTALAMNNLATPTLNYNGDFAKDTTISNSGTTTLFLNNTIKGGPVASGGQFINGTGQTSLTSSATPITYTFAVKDTKPETITLQANDADIPTATGTEQTTQIRSGRARLENVFGPELTSLTMPLKIEYYSDNATPADLADDGFVLNTDDSCTAYDATIGTLANYTGNLAAGETTVTGAGTIVAGIGKITFSAPGAGNDGSVNLLANNISSWLTYPWGVDCDGDTVNDAGACGTASFGLYRGDDRIIYWREVFQ